HICLQCFRRTDRVTSERTSQTDKRLSQFAHNAYRSILIKLYCGKSPYLDLCRQRFPRVSNGSFNSCTSWGNEPEFLEVYASSWKPLERRVFHAPCIGHNSL